MMGEKISQKFANSLPPDENGNVPSFKAIEKWRDSYGWLERADAMDVEVSRRFQDEAVSKRIKMYEEHVEVSNKLIEKGKAFLVDHPIDEMSDALKAISLGVEIQRASVGQIELGQKILGMSDAQLLKELTKLLGKPENKSEFIDAETEEIETDD